MKSITSVQHIHYCLLAALQVYKQNQFNPDAIHFVRNEISRLFDRGAISNDEYKVSNGLVSEGRNLEIITKIVGSLLAIQQYSDLDEATVSGIIQKVSLHDHRKTRSIKSALYRIYGIRNIQAQQVTVSQPRLAQSQADYSQMVRTRDRLQFACDERNLPVVGLELYDAQLCKRIPDIDARLGSLSPSDYSMLINILEYGMVLSRNNLDSDRVVYAPLIHAAYVTVANNDPCSRKAFVTYKLLNDATGEVTNVLPCSNYTIKYYCKSAGDPCSSLYCYLGLDMYCKHMRERIIR